MAEVHEADTSDESVKGEDLRFLKKSVTATHERTGGGFAGRMARLVSSGLYVGYIPYAQGTVGSLLGPVLYLIAPAEWLRWLWYGLPVLFILGVWSAGASEAYWGHDPGRVVIDEVVGMLVTLAFLFPSRKALLAGFVLFRLFDIVKPFPVRALEKLPGGWGVMMDDVMAGVYALVVLRTALHFFPRYL